MSHSDFARQYVESLISEYDLVGWKFVWSNGTKIAGHCKYRNKDGSPAREIAFSRKLIKAMSLTDIRETALHEVAHAIVGEHAKAHGHVWRRQYIAMGGNGERTHSLDPDRTIVRAKYVGLCENGHRHYKDRMGKHIRSGNLVCLKDGCNRAKITWSVNTAPVHSPSNLVDIGDGFSIVVSA